MPGEVLLVLIGLATGFIAGLLGAGAGFGTVVLLIAAGTGPHLAIGTSPIYTTVIGSWGTILHLRRGNANARLALAMGLPSAVTAFFGAQLADASSAKALVVSFGAVTLAVAGAFLVWPVRKDEPAPPPISGAQEGMAGSRRRHAPLPLTMMVGAVVGGAFIGILQGLYGVGGGFLLMPFMVLVLKIPERVAVGSSLFALVFGSISSGVRHALLGNVGAGMLVWLIPGGLIGSFAGAALVRRVAPSTIRRTFVAMMFVSAAYLLNKGL
ncbi:MAG TPA: sulfite exporter TauE/SafE family protein [Actinomycetota bacterium]